MSGVPGADSKPDTPESFGEGRQAKPSRMDELAGRLSQKPRLSRLPTVAAKALKVVWVDARREFVATTTLQVIGGFAGFAQLAIGAKILRLMASRAPGSGGEIVRYALLFGVVVLLAELAGAVQQPLTQRQSRVLGRRNEERMLDAAAAMELQDFETPEFFDRLSRARTGGGFAQQVVVGLAALMSATAGIVGVASALLFFQPLLLGLLLLAYAPVLWGAVSGNREHYFMVGAFTGRQRLRGYIASLLTGREAAKEVRLFGLNAFLRERHDRLYDEYFKEQSRVERRRAIRATVASLLSAALLAGVVGGLAWLVASGRLSLVSAGVVVGAVFLIQPRLQGVVGGFSSLHLGGMFIDDYFAFNALVLGRRAAEAERGPRLSPFEVLEAKNLSYHYPGKEGLALDDVSIRVQRGQVVALVGENGSGKTTLAKLLCRLYRPSTGAVLWDGIDTAQVHADRVQVNVAAVFQDFVRFNMEARASIAMGDPALYGDLEAVVAAAKRADAHSFISELPFGYETMLGPEFSGGTDLSTGQWQRVALARAFLRDASFLILDEPTAALDARAEHELFESMRALSEGKSVLLITHRLASVRTADRIYVLDKGRLIEQGTHATLMAQGGRYAELFNLQAASYADPPATPKNASPPAVGLPDEALALLEKMGIDPAKAQIVRAPGGAAKDT